MEEYFINGWSYGEDDSYTFKVRCKACGYENRANYDKNDSSEKFSEVEQSFISIKPENYDYYESTVKYKLYICPMCGTVIAISK